MSERQPIICVCGTNDWGVASEAIVCRKCGRMFVSREHLEREVARHKNETETPK